MNINIKAFYFGILAIIKKKTSYCVLKSNYIHHLLYKQEKNLKEK